MVYELTIEPLGETVKVSPGQTMLDAALRHGVYLPHACCHGLCGTCKVQVINGDVEHGDASPFALMDFERNEGKALACSATLLSNTVIDADVDDDPDARREPVNDYTATVAEKRQLTPTVVGVWLELDRDIGFQAGKYINLHLPGIDEPRAFSMANPPSQTRLLELNVRRVPGGTATSYIHDKLNVGDNLKVTGPYGRFFVRTSVPGDVLFLAGGTGLSSVKSAIMDLIESNDSRNITLINGQRNRAELYYHDVFLSLAKRNANFTYIPALSEPEQEDEWGGFVGFVHEAANAHFDGRFDRVKAYICGPPPMVDASVAVLMRGRLFERDIYIERFITAADAAQNQARSPLFKAV